MLLIPIHSPQMKHTFFKAPILLYGLFTALI